MKKVVLASGNAGKLREFSQLLVPRGWEVLSQASLGVKETDEPHGSFVENALRKARNASKQTGLPALADDSGICVPVLSGAPGVYSARYAQRAGRPSPEGADQANNLHLVDQLAGRADRRAYYYCVLVLIQSVDDPCPIIADGRWWGEVLEMPRGQGGFGYDPYFLIPSLNQTVAQLSVADKNLVSHRGLALARLVEMIA